MGKLQTAVNLPKRILLQGWEEDQSGDDINGEYTFYYKSSSFYVLYQNIYLNLNKIATDGVVDSQNINRPAIVFRTDLNKWIHISDDAGWDNPSTNSNILPLNGWNIYDAQGPAGTITFLEDINTKISIKKQNLSGGKIIASKLSSYSLSISNIGYNTVGSIFPGDENGRFAITFTVPDLIRSYIISYQVEIVELLTGEADTPTFSIFTTNLAISSEVAEVPCYLVLRIRGVGRQPNSFTAWSPIFTYGAIGPGCTE